MDVTEIGNRIKKRRTALEMTQKDLAKEMNVSNQLISKWETGESVPSLEYLDALCKALNVDYSYFTSDGESASDPTATQPDKPKRQKKFKWNWKLFIIIAVSVFTAAFIAGFTVLTIFVFVPLANRKKYFNEIDIAETKYFEQGFYSINVKTEIDGDIKDDYRYDGYFDEDGSQVFYDTKSKRVVKDDVLTYTYGNFKYHYTPTETYETLEDMAIAKVNADIDDDDMNLTEDIDKDIRYIRRIKNGFYLELRDEFFTDNLSGTQRKNYKLTDKIKGWIEIKDGLLSSMKATVKFLNKPDNEHFTISVIMEFIAEKPFIEHKDLEGREWNGTYVGDTWYPPKSPEISNDPVIDTASVCEDIVSTEEFISRLTGGKAKKLPKDFDFNQTVLDGHLKDSGNYYCYFDGDQSAVILNKSDFSYKDTIRLTEGNSSVNNFYVYKDNIYFTSAGYFSVARISTGTVERLFLQRASYKITYNGGYAIYEGYIRDTLIEAFNVISLSKGKIIHSYYNYANLHECILDASGGVYGIEYTDGKHIPVYRKNDDRTVLNGKDYFRVDDGHYLVIYREGDTIFTQENDTVYAYEKGELKETLLSSDERFKEKNRVKLSNGYYVKGTSYICDENGDTRWFKTFKLKDENGKQETVYDYSAKEIVADFGDKLIVSIGYSFGYYLVYDQADLSKPLYFTRKPVPYTNYCDYDEMEFFEIGDTVMIAVRISGVDYYGYELYYL